MMRGDRDVDGRRSGSPRALGLPDSLGSLQMAPSAWMNSAGGPEPEDRGQSHGRVISAASGPRGTRGRYLCTSESRSTVFGIGHPRCTRCAATWTCAGGARRPGFPSSRHSRKQWHEVLSHGSKMQRPALGSVTRPYRVSVGRTFVHHTADTGWIGGSASSCSE